MITRKNFKNGDQVLLYDSKFHLFPGKLKSRWTGPFIVHQSYPNGLVDLLNPKGNQIFKVNGQRIKPYAAQFVPSQEELILLDPRMHEIQDWEDSVYPQVASQNFALFYYLYPFYF